MENIFWSAYSTQERHASIEQIQKVVGRYGSIVGFKPFSDLSLSLEIEVDAFKIDDLFDALKTVIAMDPFHKLHTHSTKERTVFLNITFVKATGNLLVEVPAVPG